ncbi:MAG: sodium:calcium antiporter [Alphaproteobacteria bacterium]|nr:sodium:calcium antiporter [Alphaproteobacteria bacterium]
MPLTASIVFVVLGFFILLYSGDCLVRGALAAAHKANVSPLLVGIVIVGFGTSMPEFIIAIRSTLEGSTGLAHGNIIGSNIANIWLVIAIPAIIYPMAVTAPRMRATALVMLAATAAWIGITLFYGLNPLIGAVFLGALAVYALLAWMFARTDMSEDTPEEQKLQRMAAWKMSTLILIGVVGLPLGSQLLVDGGISVAKSTDLSEEAIGLTILAIGSSLPELGAGLAAAFRKQSDVAMGNILGSNIFNILGAGGAIALIGPQQLSSEFHGYSHWAMGLSAVMITLLIFARRKIGFVTSGVFLLFYAAYIVGLINGWSFGEMRYLFIEQPAAGG